MSSGSQQVNLAVCFYVSNPDIAHCSAYAQLASVNHRSCLQWSLMPLFNLSTPGEEYRWTIRTLTFPK